jgi:hypothetical protein
MKVEVCRSFFGPLLGALGIGTRRFIDDTMLDGLQLDDAAARLS